MTKLQNVAIVLFLFSFLSCQQDYLDPPTSLKAPSNNTAPVNIESESISFAVIGDYGDEGDPALDVSNLVKSWDPDFIVTVGDNNYSKGELSTIEQNVSQYYGEYIYNPDAPEEYQCFGEARADQQNRFFPALGNHDQSGEAGYLPYLLYFALPGEEIYYDFQWGPVHFFTVNSGKETDHNCCDSEQALWLKEQLEKSTKPFKIVFFHHPPHSSSKHGSSTDMQWPFEDWGADAVLSGHEHTYERITKKDNPDFPYIVNGLGGKKSKYPCNANPLDADLLDNFCYEEDYGAMKCSATSDKLVLQFIAVGDPDKVIDEFVVRK